MSTDGCGQVGRGAGPPPGAGVLYLSIGEGFAEMTAQSLAFLRRHGYAGPVRVVADRPWRAGPDEGNVEVVPVAPTSGPWGVRHYKTQLHKFAYPTTLFLDADTLPIASLDLLWDELRWGDVCLAHDIQSTAGAFADANWHKLHLHRDELRLMKQPGFSRLGYYNSGVILWRKTEATDRLFETWRREWSRFSNLDQMALSRALKTAALTPHTLSPIWNCPPSRFASITAAQRSGVRVLHFLSQQRQLMSRFIDEDHRNGTDPPPRWAAPRPPEPEARRRIRALWITSAMFPRIGGIETYVEKTTSALSEYCDMGLVTRNGQWPRDGTPIAHFTLSEPAARNQTEVWRRMADALRGLIDRFEPDVVHFANARSASCRSVVPREVATVATVHGNDLTNLIPADREEDPTPYVVESLNACDQILTCSEHASELVLQWGVSTPIDTFTLGCDLDFYRPWPALRRAARRQLKIPERAPMILTVSRLVPRKGHLTVLEGIRRLSFPAYWVAAGSGPSAQEILDATLEKGMADRVRMVGAVSDETLLGLYNACDLFVLTPESQRLGPFLDSEGFGLVLQEAGACGKPVIGSAADGCQDAVIDGGTGLLVPPGDPQRLSEAMHAILTDAGLARAFGENGLQLVTLSGGWPRLARQTFEAYEDLLARRGTRLRGASAPDD